MSAGDQLFALQRRERIMDEVREHGSVNVSDVAARLGVSELTIRRDINALAQQGLVTRVHGGATLRSSVEPGLAPGLAGHDPAVTKYTIGMVVPSLDYYWPDVVRGAEETAREFDMRVVLRGSSYETEDDRPQLARLVERFGVDGLIVAPRMDTPTAEATAEWLAATGLPVVLLERTAMVGPHRAVFESVVTDHALGAAMAVHHLASLGHRRIGVLTAQPSPTRPHVHRGWLEALAECGIDPGTRVYLGVTMQHHRHFAYEGVPVVTPDGAEFGLRFTTFTFHEGGLQ